MKIIDDGEYLTVKDRIREAGGGKWRISVRKGTLSANEFQSMTHAKQGVKTAT